MAWPVDPTGTRAVILGELVRVITRVLLSGSDKGRAGASGRAWAAGPPVCEASPFSRSLRGQGRPGGRAAQGSRACGMACEGPAWPQWSFCGSSLGSRQLPGSWASLSSLCPRWGHYRFSSPVWVYKLQHTFGCKIFSKCRSQHVCTSSVVSLHGSISLQPLEVGFPLAFLLDGD